MIQPFWKTVYQFLTKLNITYDPAITLRGIHPKKLKNYILTKTCTGMFITVSIFIISKTWKQQKCNVNEKINGGISRK